MQPYAPLCNWFTPGAVHILSIVPRKLISTNWPIKGIIHINQKLKTFLKVIIAVKKIIQLKRYGYESNCSEDNYFSKFLITVLIICN